jgi:hypothetical protein
MKAVHDAEKQTSGKLTDSIILLHDNACPSVAHRVKDQ